MSLVDWHQVNQLVTAVHCDSHQCRHFAHHYDLLWFTIMQTFCPSLLTRCDSQHSRHSSNHYDSLWFTTIQTFCPYWLAVIHNDADILPITIDSLWFTTMQIFCPSLLTRCDSQQSRHSAHHYNPPWFTRMETFCVWLSSNYTAWRL